MLDVSPIQGKQVKYSTFSFNLHRQFCPFGTFYLSPSPFISFLVACGNILSLATIGQFFFNAVSYEYKLGSRYFFGNQPLVKDKIKNGNLSDCHTQYLKVRPPKRI